MDEGAEVTAVVKLQSITRAPSPRTQIRWSLSVYGRFHPYQARPMVIHSQLQFSFPFAAEWESPKQHRVL